MNKIVLFVLLMLFLCGYTREFGYAKEFVERSVDGFQQLDEFLSISEFENDMNKYAQDCLDNSFGGSLSVRCFVGYEFWDRELNKYYRLLSRRLVSEGKDVLKVSQIS